MSLLSKKRCRRKEKRRNRGKNKLAKTYLRELKATRSKLILLSLLEIMKNSLSSKILRVFSSCNSHMHLRRRRKRKLRSLRMKILRLITKRAMNLKCLISVILCLMHCQGNRLSWDLSPPMLNNSHLKIFTISVVSNRLLKIRAIKLSRIIIFSKTVLERSSKATTFLLLTNRRIITLTTTIIRVPYLILNTTIKEVISSSQGNNTTTLNMGIWLQHQVTQIVSSSRGDRAATITIKEEIKAMGTPPYPKATKVYLLSTTLHSLHKVMLLSLNRQILRQLEGYNQPTVCPKFHQ